MSGSTKFASFVRRPKHVGTLPAKSFDAKSSVTKDDVIFTRHGMVPVSEFEVRFSDVSVDNAPRHVGRVPVSGPLSTPPFPTGDKEIAVTTPFVQVTPSQLELLPEHIGFVG